MSSLSPRPTESAAADKPAARDLFTPIQIGDLQLPSRIVMAPLTRNRAGPGNAPVELNTRYYAQRASAGLVISEATQASWQSIGYPNTPGIHTPEQIAGWRKVIDAVHQEGGRMFLQIWHVGRISHPSMQPDGGLPLAPSAIAPAGQAITYDGMKPYVTPRALKTGEIQGIVEEFRQGARNAIEAGFDGVEVHGANGYLLDQFLRDGSNQRQDRYGGAIENRARFMLEVLEAVLDVWPSNRVGIRLSPSAVFNDMRDSHPRATFGYLVDALNRYKLAYLHIIEPAEADEKAGVPLVPSSYFRPIYKGRLMVNGDYDGAKGNQVIASGNADLVSFGKRFLANPDLPRRLAEGAPLNTPDQASFYGGDARGYVDYPSLDAVA
ncbi:MAG: alkene reductase [Gammaproteobacteria bacterium]